ncbi:MAG: lytic transglycosylase domain-containing protein [Ruminococcaceae bacterium]|jgi:soluble lytic murein transglycosylase|nr:lytic transglycosylase domain-containing protein [Oscillospiraceae bacterium]HHV32059.1 lytic transglycosylase domain-containing protein [Clostridiales bacterium]
MKRYRKPYKKPFFIVVGLVLLLVLGYFVLSRCYDSFMKQAYPLKYSEIVSVEATENKLDPALVYSVIKVESNFDAEAVSHAGAVGLMQLTPDTFEWLRTKSKSENNSVYTSQDLKMPNINIRYGCRFLALLLKKYSNTRTALSAYNAGIGTVNGWLKDSEVSKDGITLEHIPYAETRKYVDAVLKNYEKYKSLYQFNSKGEMING